MSCHLFGYYFYIPPSGLGKHYLVLILRMRGYQRLLKKPLPYNLCMYCERLSLSAFLHLAYLTCNYNKKRRRQVVTNHSTKVDISGNSNQKCLKNLIFEKATN